jgi:hypothetical protein
MLLSTQCQEAPRDFPESDFIYGVAFFFQEKGHCFNLLHHQFICIIESTPARVILILIWSRFSLVTSGVLLPKRTYYVCNWRICILIFLKFDTCCSIEINKLMRYTFTIHCSCD